MSQENALTNTTPLAIEGQGFDRNPAAVYLASLGSDNSRSAMSRALNVITDLLQPDRFVEPGRPDPEASKSDREAYRTARKVYDARCLVLPWQELRFQHTQAIRAELARQYKYTMVNNMLSALRGVLNTAANLGLMSADDCRAACQIKAVKGQSNPAGRDLGTGEILALAMACKKDLTPAGARDAALIGVLYSCGLRRAEVVGLDLADYDPDAGKIAVRRGKGNKERGVYVSNGAQKALDQWIAVRGSAPGPLFLPINKVGRLDERRMTTQAVYIILKKRAEQAGVKDFSPHDFRRTFVGDLLDRGADIATVQKLAGHASVTTTARYDRRPEEVKRKAASLLHFPF
jgi:integrase